MDPMAEQQTCFCVFLILCTLHKVVAASKILSYKSICVSAETDLQVFIPRRKKKECQH
jgi:hypothetical protein